MFEIIRYCEDKAKDWNQFVAQSKNGTFLFDRRYMDYHANRFQDHSLMIYRRGILYALLPANEKENTIYSHQGLTFGGLLMNEKATASDIIHLFHQMNVLFKEEGFRHVIYKPVPWIYHLQPAEEDLYAIIKECRACLMSRNLSSTISQTCPNKWYRIRENGSKKARELGLTVEKSEEWSIFWDILTRNLKENHHVLPVHSVEEILLLHHRFPQQIQLFVVKEGHNIIGGTVLYVTKRVLHTQYIAANERGKEVHALDLLFRYVIEATSDSHVFFDFGISTEQQGNYLNEGLIYQKEGFGGRAICYDCYEWDV